MAELEKVIRGLEICIRVQDNEKCPDECPYRKDICYGTVGLMADALSLLKAQEPRVMMLDELQSHDGAVWVEYNSGSVNYEPRWAFFDYMNNTAIFLRFWRLHNEPGYNKKSYGIVWRCWTSRPTDEQREAVKWE